MWKSEPQGVLPWALSPAVTDRCPAGCWAAGCSHGGADGQVAAVLVHQRLQLALLRGGCGASLVRLEQRVGGDGAVGAVAGLAQIDLHAVVDGGMIGDVRFLDGGVALVGGVLHDLGDAGVHLGGGFAGAVGRILLLVVRRGGDVQRDRLRVGDFSERRRRLRRACPHRCRGRP